jgi:hypothetical protein
MLSSPVKLGGDSALDEAERIETAIRGARSAPLDDGRDDPERSSPDGARRPWSRRGAGARGSCAAAGARASLARLARERRATLVLFLHADTRLPPAGAAVATLRDPGVGGAFRLRFDERSPCSTSSSSARACACACGGFRTAISAVRAARAPEAIVGSPGAGDGGSTSCSG